MGQYRQTFFFNLDTGQIVTSATDNRTPTLRRWVAGDKFSLSIGFLRAGENVTGALLESGASFVRAQVKAELGPDKTVLASGTDYAVDDGMLTFGLSLNTDEIKAAVNAETGDTATLWFIVETESSDSASLTEWIQEQVPVNKEGITSDDPVDPAHPGYWDKVESDIRYYSKSGDITEAELTAGAYEIDFDSGEEITRLSVDDDFTLTDTGAEAGQSKSRVIYILNTDAAAVTGTFPVGWRWFPDEFDAEIPPNDYLILSLRTMGTDVFAMAIREGL